MKNTTNSKISASQIITDSIKWYTKDEVVNRVQSTVDGLKSVQRRSLWSLRNKHDIYKQGAVVAEIAAKYHPHGDASLAESIDKFMQDFNIGYPLFVTTGKKGSYDSGFNSASSMRYATTGISEFALDVFFRNVRYDTIPMKETEFSDGTYEPIYLIPRIPTALIYSLPTIGTGFAAKTVPYDLMDVCDLCLRYIDTNGEMDFSKEQFLIPSFPYLNHLLNEQSIIESYKKGNFTPPIYNEGDVSVFNNENSVIVHALGYGNDFKNAYDACMAKFIANAFAKGGMVDIDHRHGMALTFKKGSVGYAHQVLKTMPLSDSLIPNLNYIGSDGRMRKYEYPTIFYEWFMERRRSIYQGDKKFQKEYLKRILCIDALFSIMDVINDVVDFLKTQKLEDEAVRGLMAKFNIRMMQAKAIASMKLIELVNANKIKLAKERETLYEKLEVIADRQKNVNAVIYDDVEFIQQKYRKLHPRCTYSLPYVGYVHLENIGTYQLRDYRIDVGEAKSVKTEVCEDTLMNNIRSITDIKMYYPRLKGHTLCKRDKTQVFPYKTMTEYTSGTFKKTKFDIPKQFTDSNGIVCLNEEKYTLVLQGLKSKRTACFVKGIYPPIEGKDVTYRYCRSDFLSMHRDGNIVRDTIKTQKMRKNICAGVKSDIVDIFPVDYGPLMIFSMCNRTPNVLSIDYVDPTEGAKIALSPTGDIRVLGWIPLYSEVHYMLIPQDCVKLFNSTILRVDEVKKLCGDKPLHIKVDMKKKQKVNGCKFRKKKALLVL